MRIGGMRRGALRWRHVVQDRAQLVQHGGDSPLTAGPRPAQVSGPVERPDPRPTVPQGGTGRVAARARIDELQRQLGVQRAEIRVLQKRPGQAVEITPDAQHEVTTVARAEGVSLGVVRRLWHVVAGPKSTPTAATPGRATQEAGKHAGGCAPGNVCSR